MTALDEIVRGYLLQKGYDVEVDYQRYYTFFTKGLQDLWHDVDGTPTYAELTLNENGWANLPTDCTRVIGVGVVNTNGEFVSMGYNPDIVTLNECDERFDASRGVGYYPMSVNQNGNIVGRVYGQGGRVSLGEYIIDHSQGKIVFSTMSVSTGVVVHYLSTRPRQGRDFMVDDMAVEPLEYYVEWVSTRFKSSISKNEVEYNKMEYYRAKMNYKMQRWMTTMAIMMQYSRKNTKPVKE